MTDPLIEILGSEEWLELLRSLMKEYSVTLRAVMDGDVVKTNMIDLDITRGGYRFVYTVFLPITHFDELAAIIKETTEKRFSGELDE